MQPLPVIVMTHKRQNIQEDLVNLFLRLNGYFTTGLIIHSPTFGKNQTELDTISIRFPYHKQDDRVVECSEYLQIPKGTIDIIIGEVKCGKEPIQFNSALRANKNSIEKLVNWVGAFNADEINLVTESLEEIFKPKSINTPDKFYSISIETMTGKYSIRPIIFSLDRPLPKKNQTRFVSGQTILDFVWACLRPNEERESCATVYNYNMWGHSLLPIVQYFKDTNKTSVGNINDFYNYFNC